MRTSGDREAEGISWAVFWLVFILGVIVIIAGLMWAYPKYNVWQQGLAGEAALARATQDRQIRIEEAKAKFESAGLESKAEVLRAQGVADSVAKIEDKLTEPYLRYRFILMLEETGGAGRETIYIPTEGGMPILEATRLRGVSTSTGVGE